MPDPKTEPRADSAQQGSAPEAWFFCLRLLGGRYAFEAPLVTEVVRLGPLTRLPAAPSFLPGVFTHRGEVLPVLDIGQLVGHPPVPIRASTRAALVHCGPWKVAVVSEGVEGLVAIPRQEPRAAAGRVERRGRVPLRHRARRAGTVAILDLPRLVETARARAVPAGSGRA